MPTTSARQDARKIKVCFVAARSNYSGAARSLWQLLKYIDKDQFECSVIINHYGNGIRKLQPYASCYYFPPKKYRFRFTYRIRSILSKFFEKGWFIRRLKRINPDVIYFNTNASIAYMQWVKGLGKPIVCHIHGEKEGLVFRTLTQNGHVPLPHEWIQTTKTVPDHFIACACACKKVLTGELGIPASSITVAHEAIDLDEMNDYKGQLTKDQVEGWAGKMIIGVNASFNYRKGVDVFIKAVGQLRNVPAADNCLFVWFGEGQEPSYWQYCQNLIQEVGIQDQISFMGQATDIYKYLKLFDIFILPTRDECLPLSMLEAMAFRKPVVVTAVSGIPEAINEKNGILVAPDDPQALAEGILKAINNIKKGDISLVEQAYKDVQRFDAAVQAKKIEKSLSDLLTGK